MTPFYDFLRERNAQGGFTTEDTLVAFLPLMRQVIDCHSAGRVAPLEGLDSLRVEGPRIWFEDGLRRQPRDNNARVAQVLAEAYRGAAVVTDEQHVEIDDDGGKRTVDAAIGDGDSPPNRPLYLPRYVAWEHALEHHDPLTDVFSLGMILASLSCGVDFHEPRDLEAFVRARRNLFQLNAELHPVLARAIEQMTELNRNERPTDLGALLQSLENFGSQQVEFQLELDRIAGFHTQDLESKHQIVLAKLQERLFDVSRRNRLLHFRPTMQTVNLTEASVPLSFDYKNIRAEQLLTWNEKFAKAAVRGEAIQLEEFLNFEEAVYLPMVLDRIRNESRKDQAEFGFSQLRLVAAFLRWTNVKANPPESYNSPLALLPVELTRKKGVKDTYRIRILSAEAEINPVIRHQFKQLFEIELPETIDLEQTDLATFHQFLTAKVRESESAVEVELIDRPRISVLHDRAKRRLDAYRRRARLAGRGVRSFLDIDYSYDPANYHPLGLKLFSQLVRPPQTRLSAIAEREPRPMSFAVESDPPPSDTKKKSFFSLHERVDDNPYHWELDLCAVTLGNFRYRKMSLVRDYTAASGETLDNAAFDAIFSLSPRPPIETIDTPDLDERFHVVPCDPTQTLSIARAKTGASYIIQGPPGTGKSQTITNLIADYVARGKRVLFVCEKRAAIDVVYLRLRQQRLDRLCCLIHDSQQDKKRFVMDLKETYESFLHPIVKEDSDRRDELTLRLKHELDPLESFRDLMLESEDDSAPLLSVLQRAIELKAYDPGLSPRDLEQAPPFTAWNEHRDLIEQFGANLAEVSKDGVCAAHPFSRLSTDLPKRDRPLEAIAERLGPAQRECRRLVERIAELPIPGVENAYLLRSSAEFCRQLLPLAQNDLLSLLRPDSAASRQYEDAQRSLRKLESRLKEAQEQNTRWRRKLTRGDTEDALALAKRLEPQWWSFLNPSWWRLRGVLRKSYDFEAHTVKPAWTDVLSRLMEEHDAERALQSGEEDVAESLGIRDYQPHNFFEEVAELRRRQEGQLDAAQQSLLDALIDAADGPGLVQGVLEAEMIREQFQEAAAGLLEQFEERSWQELDDDLATIQSNEEDWPAYLDCLSLLGRLPAEVARSLRQMPLRLEQIEFAAAERQIEAAFRNDRSAGRFDAQDRERLAARLERIYEQWLEGNATEISRRVAARFRENIRICSLPAAQLEPEQKTFKKRYQRGRKELEHEFGKKMRYKAIRDLVSGDSGEVVKDLKPVWLMSPLSVSDALPLDQDHFDVVIFDEASQITLEEAVPTIFRATQAIVVGDEMQLPPTDFFSTRREEDDVLMLEDEGELVEYALDSDSLLTHSARNLPSTMLGWHYRSRSESLISFSNWSFYQGGLLTVPEEELATEQRDELIVTAAENAVDFAAELGSRAVSFHFLEQGVYEKRRNRAEADYIAHLVRKVLSDDPHYSIGVVAFSEAQQGEIEAALNRLAAEDRVFADRLELELEREESDGQFAGLLVKNLENIQGDERDLIIMSVCYGRDPQGKIRMNFGPINQQGGEKRLNVAFSRAKHRMALVSSIRHFDVTNDYNTGANCLKRYLLYAERVSIGDMESAQRLLEDIGGARDRQTPREENVNAVAGQISRFLEHEGYQVDHHVGQSQFRCELAVRRGGDSAYRLGVRLDTDGYYADDDPLEREMMKPKLLRDFGWRLEVVLTKDWFTDQEQVKARLLERLTEPVAVPLTSNDNSQGQLGSDLEKVTPESDAPESDANFDPLDLLEPESAADKELADKEQTDNDDASTDGAANDWDDECWDQDEA